MNKPPSHSLYSKLTEDQRIQLYDWILTFGYVKAKERVALPEPEGFGFATHLSSLHRFFKRRQREVRSEDIAAAKESRSHPEDASILLSDTEQSLQHAAHQIAHSPMDSDQFRDVSRWMATHKDHALRRDYYQIAAQQLALARERLAFERERYEYDMARKTIIHYRELEQISNRSSISDEDRINQARSLLFGIPIDKLPR